MAQVWMITGSSRGLGRQITTAALRAGHSVAATARTVERLADLEQDFGDRVLTVPLDVTDPEAAHRAVERTVSHFGRLDVVVNNAGQADFGAVEDTPAASLAAQIDINLWGVVHVTRAALPLLRDQGSGLIVQVSSLGARMGTPGLAAYQAAKAAVNTFSASLREELRTTGVRVTIVEPGSLRTDMLTTDSMTVLPISGPYRPSLAPVAEGLRSQNGNQPGDPMRAGEVIVQAAGLAEPPERLVLGSDALDYARTAAARLAESDARWADLSRSIDFPASAAQRPSA